MSEQNVTIVRAVYDSFAAGDVDAVFAAMTPDIEWDESEGMPYGGVYHGREAIVSNVFGPILADVEGFTAAPDEILPLDDTRVVALGRHGGQGADGPLRARFVHIWTVTNGLVSRYQQLADTHLQNRRRQVVPGARRVRTTQMLRCYSQPVAEKDKPSSVANTTVDRRTASTASPSPSRASVQYSAATATATGTSWVTTAGGAVDAAAAAAAVTCSAVQTVGWATATLTRSSG